MDEYIQKQERCLKHLNRGEVLLENGKIFNAIREYYKALKYEPNMPEVLNNLGYAYSIIGRKEKAYIFFRRCFEVIDEIIKATEIVDKTVNLPDDYALMLANAGTTLMDNKDPDAKRCLEMAVRIGPKNWPARFNLGVYYYNEGLIEAALREHLIAYKLAKDDADVVLNLSECYIILGMEDEAAEVLEKYLKEHPPKPDLLASLVTAYGNLNRTEEANNVCQQWVRLEPDSPAAHAGLGLGYAILGRREDAYREIATAIKLNEKVHDELAEDWIKRTLEILEDPHDNFNLLIFYLMLAIMKARMKRMQQLLKR